MSEGDFRVVVVAGSLGGIEALQAILGGLRIDFPAAVLVAQHRASTPGSALAEVLGRCTPLQVKEADDGEIIGTGTVYLAPPDHHLLVDTGGILRLSAGPKLHHVRPSAEPLFESAALVFGRRTVAVVLSGTGVDGSDGVRCVRDAGGTVIVQDEATSMIFGMPGASIDTGCVDEVHPLQEIAGRLIALAGGECRKS